MVAGNDGLLAVRAKEGKDAISQFIFLALETTVPSYTEKKIRQIKDWRVGIARKGKRQFKLTPSGMNILSTTSPPSGLTRAKLVTNGGYVLKLSSMTAFRYGRWVVRAKLIDSSLANVERISVTS